MNGETTIETDWAEAAEFRVLEAALNLAPVLGWGAAMLGKAAAEAGLSPGAVQLVLPGGPRDLAALLSRRHDQAALAALKGVDPMSLKVRERITRAVEARLDAVEADAPAARRCAGFLALPPNLMLGARLVWESADLIWRWAGDAALDENHYSKRAILAGVLASTVAVDLEDGRAAASATLEALIGQVMAFERWKAGVKAPDVAGRLAGALGRLRYRRA